MTTGSDLPAAAVASSWRSFLERCESLRPELYRYCRHLTRSPWDAEDLVQDSLARAFVALGCAHQEIENPRAWLFRVASNQWLNQVRRSRSREMPSELIDREPSPSHSVDPRASREAAGTMIARLAPQERAAVVLKDVFDFSLEEIGEALSTSVGAVKAALHRGRGKLADPEPDPERAAAAVPAVLDAFCTAFNARDIDRLTALLLDSAIVEAPGLSVEYGAQAARKGSLAGILFGDPSSDRCGIAPEYRVGVLPRAPRLELRVHRGEALLLAWFAHDEGECVRSISRAEVEGDRIAHLWMYLHAPDALAEICREIGVPFRSSGYRYWW